MVRTTSTMLGFPAYAMAQIDADAVVIGGGGGTLRSGVPNEMRCYRLSGGQVDLVNSLKVDDVLTSVAVNEKTRHVAAVVGDRVQLFLAASDLSDFKVVDSQRQREALNSSKQARVMFSASGSRLLVASDCGTIEVFSFPTLSGIARCDAHKQPISDLHSDPSGRFVASVSRDRCCVWDSSSGAVLQTLQPASAKAHVRGVRFHERLRILLVAENEHRVGGSVSVWSYDDGWRRKRTAVRAMKKEHITAMTTSAGAPDIVALGGSEGGAAVARVDGRGALHMLWRSRRPLSVLAMTSVAVAGEKHDRMLCTSADATVTQLAFSSAELALPRAYARAIVALILGVLLLVLLPDLLPESWLQWLESE